MKLLTVLAAAAQLVSLARAQATCSSAVSALGACWEMNPEVCSPIFCTLPPPGGPLTCQTFETAYSAADCCVGNSCLSALQGYAACMCPSEVEGAASCSTCQGGPDLGTGTGDDDDDVTSRCGPPLTEGACISGTWVCRSGATVCAPLAEIEPSDVCGCCNDVCPTDTVPSGPVGEPVAPPVSGPVAAPVTAPTAPPMAAPVVVPPTGGGGGTMMDALDERPEFSTLAGLIREAGLEARLDMGGVTLLAPINAAFDNVPQETLDFLTDPANAEDLAALLTYHALPGSMFAADFTDGPVATLLGPPVDVSLVSAGGITFNDVSVVEPNILPADMNGVIHGISEVLIPPQAPTEPPVLAPTGSAPTSPIPAPVVPPVAVPTITTTAPAKAPTPRPVATPPPFNYPPGSDQCFPWSFQTGPNRRSRRIQFRPSDTK